MPTFEYKADAATPCLTLIPAPVTLEYTHGTAMIGSLVTIEKRIPEYAVTEDADETWETLPIEQLSSELERYCGVAVRTRRVLTATDEADAGANAAEKARDAGVGAGAGAGSNRQDAPRLGDLAIRASSSTVRLFCALVILSSSSSQQSSNPKVR